MKLFRKACKRRATMNSVSTIAHCSWWLPGCLPWLQRLAWQRMHKSALQWAMAQPLLIAPDDCRDVCHDYPDCAIGATTKLHASQQSLMRDRGPHQTASNSAKLNVCDWMSELIAVIALIAAMIALIAKATGCLLSCYRQPTNNC